jgi:glycosyltransferase involved in cell wall biosynthesis
MHLDQRPRGGLVPPTRTAPEDAAGLRIGLIAPPAIPVPPRVYGGTELVVDLLARGLTAAGAEVVLVTAGDSTCPVERRWLHETSLGTTIDPEAALPHVRFGYRALDEVDVIHDHTILGPVHPELHPRGVPVVTTIHGELTPPMRERYILAAAAGVANVAISGAQQRSAPTVPVETVIHHGIEVGSYPRGSGNGGYLLFVGRMGPEKGPDRAIRVARAAGRRIVLAAKMWEPVEKRFFAEFVEPLLGDDAIYVGAVGAEHKLALLAGAEALLNPIRWPEPFGLVMIESLASGTPVITFPEGAAPEIVDDGRTGFLCADEDAMVRAVSLLPNLDRDVCRASVSTRFSAARMCSDHAALYRRLLRRAADRVTTRGGDAPRVPTPSSFRTRRGVADVLEPARARIGDR